MRTRLALAFVTIGLVLSADAFAQKKAAAPPPPPKAEAWVLIDAGQHDVRMSGSSADVDKARKLSGGKPILWFRMNGAEYVVSDAKVIAAARAAFAPTEALGERMGKLGDKMGALGEKMGQLGKRMGKLGGKMAIRSMKADDDPEAARELAALEREMQGLEQEMEKLQTQMAPFQAEMDKLGGEMDLVVEAAEQKLGALLAGAIKSGAATPVK